LSFKPETHQVDKSVIAGPKKSKLESSMKAVDQYVQRMQKAKIEEQRRKSIL